MKIKVKALINSQLGQNIIITIHNETKIQNDHDSWVKVHLYYLDILSGKKADYTYYTEIPSKLKKHNLKYEFKEKYSQI